MLFEIVRRGPFTVPERIDSNKYGDDNMAAFVSEGTSENVLDSLEKYFAC